MRSLSLLGVVALTATLPAQLPQEQVHAAGLGAQKQVIDLSATNNGLMLGVAYLNGEYFVSGGGNDKRIFVFGEDGTLLRDFPQDAQVGGTFGLRDGATDGHNLMFGWEDGILVFDDMGNPVTTVMAANGPQSVTLPIVAASGVSTHRALAYNPMGNGGDGSIWIGNFGSDLVEIDLQGNVLTTLPNNSSWSAYGLAWDPYTETLWANSIPNSGDIAQIDPASGMATGMSFPRNQPGSAQGGLSVIPIDDTTTGGGFDLVGLDQGSPDALTRYRLHLYTEPLRDGTTENRLVTGVGGDPLDDDPIESARPGQDLHWMLATNTEFDLPKTPVWTFINVGADAAVNGTPIRGIKIPEFVALTMFSSPRGMPMVTRSFSDEDQQITMPNLNHGDLIRLQAVSVEPDGRAALIASNQMFFETDLTRVSVSASGGNSFNSNTGSGFFQVEQRFGPSITSVTFDWTTSSNPNQSDMEFDTNQGGMADRFDGGNSTVSGCQGTYRNGSDVATGLIYDAANNPAPTCDPTANPGWIGTNAGNASNDWRTLQFRFTPGSFVGQVFEFDADTDGGQGISGDDMEGMVVTIEFDDGTQVSGELQVDPNASNRSFIEFL